MSFKRTSILLSLWVLSCSLYAQKHRYVFDAISSLEGLSDNIVRSITEDRTGFMWIGTEDGLNRYDGMEIEIYRNVPGDVFSLSGNKVTSSIIDKDSNLWVGTRNGLNIYDANLDRFDNYRTSKYKCLAPLKGTIEALKEAPNGDIWAVLHAEGLVKIDIKRDISHKYKVPTVDDSRFIMSIVPDKSGTIYCGTIDGLIQFDTKHKTYTDLRETYGYGYRVNDIHIDGKGRLLMATSDGFKIVNLETKKVITYRHDPNNRKSISGNEVQKLLPGKNGNCIIAVDGGGIDVFDKRENRFYHNSSSNHSHLTSDNVIALYQDSHHTLWVGTYMQGLNLSNTNTNLFSLVRHNARSKNSISPGTVSNFFEDSDGDLWIGTDGGGLNMYRPKTGEMKTFRYRSSNKKGINCDKIISIIQDQKGFIWLGTYGGGLNRYDKEKNEFKHYTHDPENHYSISSDKVKTLMEDTNGNIWVGTYGNGISVLDPKTEKFKHFRSRSNDPTTLLSDWISIIYSDRHGDIWVGSYEGLNLFQPLNGKFKGYHNIEGDPKSLNNNYVVDIYEDEEGSFWVGTSGGGLHLFNKKEETFKAYTTEHGLANNNIQSIIQDETNYLWIASKNGITKFSLISRKGQPFTVNDGLPSTTFYPNAKFRTRSGHILFGANNGYIEINPFDAKKNLTKPPVVITGFKIFNKEVQIQGEDSPLKKHISRTKKITLNYDQNSFSFQFAVLNFINPERNQFLYILEGFDQEWNEGGKERIASYTNLDPGFYTFKVQGSNNDGRWNREGVSLEIEILPPYWATWWFRLIVGFLITLFIFGLFKLRIRTIKKQNLKLENEVASRTEEVQRQKEEIQKQNFEMQENITVGKIIQDSILPPVSAIEKDFPGSFVYYQPKDIVSGDFYWYFVDLNKVYIAAVDCTGHGVAGAFMSLIGHGILSDISKNIEGLNAAEILDQLNNGVISALRQRRKDSLSRDGMDISLVIIDTETGTMDYAGAMNNLYILRNKTKELECITADKFSIGIPRRGEVKNFTNHQVQLDKGDHVYLYSDGYADQLGGEDGNTKFMYGRFRELLKNLDGVSGAEKHLLISRTMNNWKRNTDQLDDMLVMGIKF